MSTRFFWATGIALLVITDSSFAGPANPPAPRTGPRPGAIGTNRPTAVRAANPYGTRVFAANPNLFAQGLSGVGGWPIGGAYNANNAGMNGGAPIVPRVQVAPAGLGWGGPGVGYGGGGLRCVTIPTPMVEVQQPVRRFFAGAGLGF